MSRRGAPPAKAEPTWQLRAHAELDQLRQAVAREHARVRDVGLELQQAKAAVEGVAGRLQEAYAEDHDKQVQSLRRQLEKAEATVVEVSHRFAGAELRAERATEAVQRFEAERAHELLSEREHAARETTAELVRAVHEALHLHRQLRQHRQVMQTLVNAIAPGAGQTNGPVASHDWEAALGDLERAVRQHGEIEAPLPRWYGKEWRQQQDQAAERLKEERRRRWEKLGA